MVSFRLAPVRALSKCRVSTGAPPGTAVMTLTAAEALLLASATLVAVTVCEPVVAGAVYKPVLEIVPVVLLPPLMLSTDHVTAELVVPLTVAVNCCVCCGASVADVGEIATETPEDELTVM